jgi:hypothetical protein
MTVVEAVEVDNPDDEPIDPDLERLRLWVRSGGRCAMCNAKVLEHEFTALNVLTGEDAHIVGRKNSSRSPRGLHPLSLSKRDRADNLVLLCPTDHEAIDKKLGQKVWTVEDLQALKRRHEDRIDYLTGLGEDAETVVLRLIGDIRAAAVECSTQSVRAAVHANRRYPRYELGVRSESDIEIDLRGLPAESQQIYWDSCAAKIDERLQQLADGIDRGRIRHLSIFAIARISTLVYLGSRLDDKIPTDLYERHRDYLGWSWATDEKPVAFEANLIAGAEGAEKVVLLASISGTIQAADVNPDVLDGAAVYELRPTAIDPKVDLIRVPETLTAFSATYRAWLAHIENAHPSAQAIDVIGALPLTAAIELGRRRLRDVHPPLRIWERNQNGGYTLGMEVE